MIFKTLDEAVENNDYLRRFALTVNSDKEETFSPLIAKYENKKLVDKPLLVIGQKRTWGLQFGVITTDKDASEEVLREIHGETIIIVPYDKPYTRKDESAHTYAHYYLYIRPGEKLDLRYVYTAIASGMMPVLPSFMKEEFGDCGVYYEAEITDYPHYNVNITDLFRVVVDLINQGESLYSSVYEQCKKAMSKTVQL